MKVPFLFYSIHLIKSREAQLVTHHLLIFCDSLRIPIILYTHVYFNSPIFSQ